MNKVSLFFMSLLLASFSFLSAEINTECKMGFFEFAPSHHEKMSDCVACCGECVAKCQECAYSCHLPNGETDAFILCMTCAKICALCEDLSLMGSPYSEYACAACAKVCSDCADQCGKHDDACCQACAAACTKCAEACGHSWE